MRKLANTINKKLLQFESKYRISDSKLRIVSVGFASLIVADSAYAQVAQTICRLYTSIFSNEFISALAFIVFSILLCVMLLGDGQREKSALIKFAIVLAALFNLPTILGYIGASPC